MSSTDGEKETWMASTRVKSAPPGLKKYSFPWIKWLVDKLFPARRLNLEGARDGGAWPTRR